MKKLAGLMVMAVVTSLCVGVQSAKAWHANDVTVAAVCNTQTGVYDISATIIQSSQWPGATIKSITPTSYPGATVGTKPVVVVVKWSNGETWTAPTKYVALAGQCTTTPPAAFCPAGTVQIGTNPLVCLKTVTNTVTVTLPAPPAPPAVVTTTPAPPPVVITKVVTAKPKPVVCRLTAAEKKAGNVSVGKRYGVCYVKVTVTKIIRAKPVRCVHPKPDKPPKVKDCEGKCEGPYITGSG